MRSRRLYLTNRLIFITTFCFLLFTQTTPRNPSLILNSSVFAAFAAMTVILRRSLCKWDPFSFNVVILLIYLIVLSTKLSVFPVRTLWNSLRSKFLQKRFPWSSLFIPLTSKSEKSSLAILTSWKVIPRPRLFSLIIHWFLFGAKEAFVIAW